MLFVVVCVFFVRVNFKCDALGISVQVLLSNSVGKKEPGLIYMHDCCLLG